MFGLGNSGGSDNGDDKTKIDATGEDNKGDKPDVDTNGGKQDDKGGKNDEKSSGYNEESVKKLISDAISEATKDLIKDNDSLKEQIKELSRKGLTPEQIAELEKKDKEDAQDKREAELTERENRFYALTAIKDAGLDSGDKTALELINLVIGKDQNEIDANVKTLDTLVKRMVKAEVDKTFKGNGRSPKGGDDSEDKDNDNAIAKKLGKRVADANKKARGVLDMYTGGNK